MSSLSITSGTGATSILDAVPLPDGSLGLVHVTANIDSGLVTQAQDGTLALVAGLLQALAAALSGVVVIDPGTATPNSVVLTPQSNPFAFFGFG